MTFLLGLVCPAMTLVGYGILLSALHTGTRHTFRSDPH